jgi:hypothetical protein
MTAKDFELIADTLRRVCPLDTQTTVEKSVVIAGFLAVLREANPRFDRERFLRACGWDA